jgi:hypothetical protein
MKTHIIEWKRFVRKGRTCDRCRDTGETLHQLIRELNVGCRTKLVRFRLKTTRLPVQRIAESNSILIDGRPLEEIVPGVVVKNTDCFSCGELAGKSIRCRAVMIKGRTHDSVPAELIRSAMCRLADCCGHGCNCDCGCGKPSAYTKTAKPEIAGKSSCCDLNPSRSRPPSNRRRP